MCGWLCSTTSRNSGVRPWCPWRLWHNCVWGWGMPSRINFVQQSQFDLKKTAYFDGKQGISSCALRQR